MSLKAYQALKTKLDQAGEDGLHMAQVEGKGGRQCFYLVYPPGTSGDDVGALQRLFLDGLDEWDRAINDGIDPAIEASLSLSERLKLRKKQ